MQTVVLSLRWHTHLSEIFHGFRKDCVRRTTASVEVVVFVELLHTHKDQIAIQMEKGTGYEALGLKARAERNKHGDLYIAIHLLLLILLLLLLPLVFCHSNTSF